MPLLGPARPMSKLAERARVICVICHDRKVKCDLQVSLNQTCSNCRNAGAQCVRRQGVRTRKKALRRPVEGNRHTDTRPLSPAQSSAGTPFSATAHNVSYIAENSELSYKSLPQSALFNRSSPGGLGVAQAHHQFSSEASMLPKEALRQALIESYLQNCFHYFPIVDSADLCNPHKSTLLHQALCLGGSLMRQTDDQSDFELSKTLYDKCKTLLTLNFEQDPLNLLKAISMLSIWSPNSPTLVNLDGPWHWTGVAIRLAFQLGLHKEAAYVNKTDAGCKRRLWWHLYASDKLHTACWGRPEAIRESDYDVRRLTLSDFENQDLEAQCIITRMELHVIVGKISQASSEGKMPSLADLTNLALLLRNWLASLPPELALYDTTGARRPYYRPAVEMHVLYFVAIILVQSMVSPSCASIHSRKGTPLPSFLASSCIVALYEEIHYRQQVPFLLHINAFFILIAAISQLYMRQDGQREDVRRATAEKVELLCKILQKMQVKFGGAGMVLQKIRFLSAELENSPLAKSKTNPIPPNELPSAVDAQEAASWFLVPEWLNLHRIFAFPSCLCDEMALLDRVTVVEETGIVGLNSSMRSEQWEAGELAEQEPWIHDDLNFFTDIFGMDLGGFDMAHGGSLGIVDRQLVSSNFSG